MKPRRDITLGEMQDECSKRMHICAPDVDGNNECKYFEVCKQMRSGVFVKPCPEVWDLTDPPRFNEQQMALLKGLYANGVMKLRSDCAITSLFREDHEYIGNLINSQIGIELSDGETLDLAELIGKDGENR